jgi:hypothetical protein
VRLIAAPTGSGKTHAMAEAVAAHGSTCWLADRTEDVDAAAALIEANGGAVGKVAPLQGKQPDGTLNCVMPEVVKIWQEKGYNYRVGLCPRCTREADPGRCPFLRSLDELQEADVIVVTKALARGEGFFSRMGNARRENVVMDEDPIGLLRQPVTITRDELGKFLELAGKIEEVFNKRDDRAGQNQIGLLRRAARWLWDQTGRQEPEAAPAPAQIPPSLRPGKAVLSRTKRDRRRGRKNVYAELHRRMRDDPVGTPRNVARDLYDLLGRAAGGTVYATAKDVLFHLRVRAPRDKRVFVLDATGNPELLKPLFAPRPIEVLCDERVEPAGRVIQFLDSNGPRSYLNKIPPPPKLVRILDALGDLHPPEEGRIVLISHKSCVDRLRDACRHKDRVLVAHFGALRGRNDLEHRRDRPIACHVVVGSPKTTEEDRRQLALAVFGKAILPFPELATLERGVRGRTPHELTDGENESQIWSVRLKGYEDARMQAVYEHTTTAELTQAADRARVLIHKNARVYLVTNEPCPSLWFAEMCYAADYLDLAPSGNARAEKAYATYLAKVKEMLDAGGRVGNIDVCKALGKAPGWGCRYWRRFYQEMGDALEGIRKVRWKRP